MGATLVIQHMFCRLKEYGHIATRDDGLARTFASAVARFAVITLWI
jgi:hypothetical protein